MEILADIPIAHLLFVAPILLIAPCGWRGPWKSDFKGGAPAGALFAFKVSAPAGALVALAASLEVRP